MVEQMRAKIIALGGDIRFEQRVDNIDFTEVEGQKKSHRINLGNR
jgi:hypothetical protein